MQRRLAQLRRAADQRGGRCHQLRAARARSAAPRLRSRPRCADGRSLSGRPKPVRSSTTLDGEERKLDPSMLDDRRRLRAWSALAGIMGGADSEIGDDTVDVLLESAHFDALSVRRTARRLGMHTEASHRFERGADPEMAAVACDSAAALIAELAGGRVCRGRIDVYPRRSGTAAYGVLGRRVVGLCRVSRSPPERVVEILRRARVLPRVGGRPGPGHRASAPGRHRSAAGPLRGGDPPRRL